MSDSYGNLSSLAASQGDETVTFRVEVEGGCLQQVPVHHIGAVVLFGHCSMSPGAMQRLRAEINPKEDSLRIDHFVSGRHNTVESFGRDGYLDFTGPLVL